MPGKWVPIITVAKADTLNPCAAGVTAPVARPAPVDLRATEAGFGLKAPRNTQGSHAGWPWAR